MGFTANTTWRDNLMVYVRCLPDGVVRAIAVDCRPPVAVYVADRLPDIAPGGGGRRRSIGLLVLRIRADA